MDQEVITIKGLLHIPQSSKTEASSSGGLVSYVGVVGGVRDAVGVFYSHSWLSLGRVKKGIG